jgi:hypothetical protein
MHYIDNDEKEKILQLSKRKRLFQIKNEEFDYYTALEENSINSKHLHKSSKDKKIEVIIYIPQS